MCKRNVFFLDFPKGKFVFKPYLLHAAAHAYASKYILINKETINCTVVN